MEPQYLKHEEWAEEQRKIVGFVIRFGEKRITSAALQSLRHLDSSWLVIDESGLAKAALVTVRQGGRLAGVGFAADGGEGGCLVVVHPGARRLGAGRAIMESLMARLGRLRCHVAADNIPSMALCFGLGMKAVSIHKGPTGKSTLRFERGVGHDSAHTGHFDAVP